MVVLTQQRAKYASFLNLPSYVPDAFSPNADGLNEYFTGKGIGIAKFDMVILRPLGHVLIRNQDINKGWDGTVNGGNKIAQEEYICIYN